MNLYDEHALSAARRADSSWLSHLTALRKMPASDHPRHVKLADAVSLTLRGTVSESDCRRGQADHSNWMPQIEQYNLTVAD
jgi:hypothetical protein